jgi:hypothetical protein
VTRKKVIIYESDIHNRQQKFDGKLKLIPGIFSKDLNYLFSVICDELKNRHNGAEEEK